MSAAGKQRAQHAVVDGLRVRAEVLCNLLPGFLRGGEKLQREKGVALITQGQADQVAPRRVGNDLGAHLGLLPEDAVERGQALGTPGADDRGEAALAGGQVAPTLVGDGVKVALQREVAACHKLCQALGQLEIVHAVVAQAKLGQGGLIYRRGQAGRKEQDEKLDVKLAMNESGHNIPPKRKIQ